MANHCDTIQLDFHPLSVGDKLAVQQITLAAGRRNCNFTFANLVGWRFWFNTEVCVLKDAVVLRFNIEGRRAYLLCSPKPPSLEVLRSLSRDASEVGCGLTLMGQEDSHAAHIQTLLPDAVVAPQRDRYDYIYLRQELAEMRGKRLKPKRNHVNKFVAEHPDFQYVELSPALFDECRSLAAVWRGEVSRENPSYGSMVAAEQRAMEVVFSHWDELDMRGGCIYAGGRMVAFTYGAAVTYDTFDICVEKADRTIDGAFNIINQQFAAHLPEQYIYINREEDMGLEGLRKSKLSYHPHILLSYNIVDIPCPQTTPYSE